MSEINTLYSGKYLNLLERNGWEYVTRNHHDVAIILPVLPDGTIILVNEFRVPLQKRVVGLPAGIVGDNEVGEGIFDGARRELIEEIGYKANNLKLVLEESPSSSGMTNETFNLFIASDLEKVGDGGGDETEDIKVLHVDCEDLNQSVQRWKEEGHVVDPKIYIGLYFARAHGYI